MKFTFTSLGTSSALPAFGRNLAAHVLNINDKLYLLDCGEGTQTQLRKHKLSFQKIECIFISHLHGDHFFGLIGLLTSMQLLGREKPLKIYANSKLKEIINTQLKASNRYIKYPLEYIDLEYNGFKLIHSDKRVSVYSFPLKHRIPCCGFTFIETEKPRKIIKEMLEEHNIPFAYINRIKNGDDFTSGKTIIKNDELTLPPEKQKKFSYVTDTIYNESIIDFIKDSDLLYHESTFLDALAERASETFHCTAKQAATIALKANVKNLLLGHFSARYKNVDDFEKEAKEVFNNVHATVEGIEYPIQTTHYTHE